MPRWCRRRQRGVGVGGIGRGGALGCLWQAASHNRRLSLLCFLLLPPMTVSRSKIQYFFSCFQHSKYFHSWISSRLISRSQKYELYPRHTAHTTRVLYTINTGRTRRKKHIYISHFKIPRHSIPPHTAQALRSAAKCLLFFFLLSRTHSFSQNAVYDPHKLARTFPPVSRADPRSSEKGKGPLLGAVVRASLRAPFHPLSTEAPLASIASPRSGCRCTHGEYRCPWWVSGVLRWEGPYLCCCWLALETRLFAHYHALVIRTEFLLWSLLNLPLLTPIRA